MEAIDVLKGVLGFEEVPVSSHSRTQEVIPSTMVMDSSMQSPTATISSPKPPPLPQRPHIRSQLESRSTRPPLPSIASVSVINRRHESLAQPDDDTQVALVDNEGDTFADPVPNPGRRPSSPSNTLHRPTFSQENAGTSIRTGRRNAHDALNRNRSPSDPFADTHGHLNFGHGHRNSRTRGSVGGLPGPGPSPSLAPLLGNGDGGGGGGGSNIGTATSGLTLEVNHRKRSHFPLRILKWR